MILRPLLGFAVLGVALCTPATAQRDGEFLYLQKTEPVPVAKTRHMIDLRQAPGAIRGLRVRARSGRLAIRNIRLIYADGTVYDERRPITLEAGQRTRVIHPSPQDRFITSMELTIDPATSAGPVALLQIIAHQTRIGRRLPRPAKEVPPKQPPAQPPAQPPVAGQTAPTPEPVVDNAQAPDGAPRIAAGPPLPKRRPVSVRPQQAPERAIADNAAAAQPDATSETLVTTRSAQPASTAPVALPVSKASILNAIADEQSGILLLGARRVGLGLDRDVLPAGKHLGLFQRMRLRILENNLEIKALEISFADGGQKTVALDLPFAKGTQTGWIAFDRPRAIANVNVAYQPQPANMRARARIELLAERPDDWLGPNGDGAKQNDGWVLLGAHSAGFLSVDSDLVRIPAGQGQLRSLRIRVADRAIVMTDVSIRYRDGRSEIIPVRARIAADGTWGPIAINARNGDVQSLSTRYRSQFFDPKAADNGAAIVQVWGRY